MPEVTPQSQLTGQPHKTGWLWDLLGMHDRQSRPLSDFHTDMSGDSGFAEAVQEARDRLMTLGTTRKRKYEIFREMDTSGLVSAILDVYAEETTQKDYDTSKVVWVESKSKAIKAAAMECLRNCQVEDKLPALTRRLCRDGDAFQRLVYATGKGVLAWKPAPGWKVTREEDKYQRLLGFKQEGMKYRGGARDVSWPWDYVHFRLLGKDEMSGYGTSILDGMFQSWRRMTLTSESILMYRLRRMPDRNLVMVNVGNMEEHEAMAYVNNWRQRFRKHMIVDPAAAGFSKQYNPLTPLEDIFVPLIEGRESRVETLAGGGQIGEIYDLDHFRDEFFGSAKAPKAYFGFEGDINAKATLQQQDVRFARTCKRIQQADLYGVRQLLDTHLTLRKTPGETENKYDFNRPDNAYTVMMSPISYLDEFERLELMRLRYEIVEAMSRLATDMQLDPRAWATYILLNYAKLPEDLVLTLIKKTPDETASAGFGGGSGFESLTPEQQSQVLDKDRQQGKGYYELSEREVKAIAHIVHDSPGLRRSIGNWAEYCDDHQEVDLLEHGARQTDSSLVPPTVAGKILEDDVAESPLEKELKEDLAKLKIPKKEDNDDAHPDTTLSEG